MTVPASIKSRGYINVAIDPVFPPFGYYEGSTLAGLDVDLSNALSSLLGIQVRPTPSSFSAFIPGLQSGRYDIALASMTDTAVREQTLDLVDFIKAAQSSLVKGTSSIKITSLGSFCGLTVAVQTGTAPVAFLQSEESVCTSGGKKSLNLQDYPTQSAGVLAVTSGRADVFVTSTESVVYIAQQSHGTLKVDGPQLGGLAYSGVGIVRKSPLVGVILSAMRKLYADGQLSSIYAKYGLSALLIRPTVDAATSS